MRVLLIDPWGTANTSEYLNGLIYGLSPITELTVFTNYHFKLKVNSSADIHRVFFKITEKMKKGKCRKILRGIEYVEGYNRIFNFLKKQDKFDVTHINWFLKYSLDIRFIHELKKYTNRIVYTAHNVIPHIDGEKSIEQLRSIYGQCDRIVLHGEAIKKEFELYFPEYVEKIYIQKHGCNLYPSIEYDESKVPDYIKEKISKYDKSFIFFGNVFFNKGPDRLVDLWDSSWINSLLIIAGRRDSEYPQLDAFKDKIEKTDNILELNGFVEDNLLKYLIDKSVIILLPYRHASMSGVVFTAADFHKTVLCTNVGALPEYLENDVDSFVVENDDISIKNMIVNIINNYSNFELEKMGQKLQDSIQNQCAWSSIAQKIVGECYLL